MCNYLRGWFISQAAHLWDAEHPELEKRSFKTRRRVLIFCRRDIRSEGFISCTHTADYFLCYFSELKTIFKASEYKQGCY